MAVRMADPARYAPDLLGFYPQERQIDRRYEMTGVNPYAMNADRYVSGLLTDPMARAEFGTGLLQGATTDLGGTPVDVYAGAVDVAQAITPQNNQFNYYTNPFWMLSQSGDIAQKAQSVAGSEALGEAVYGKPEQGYEMYRDPARLIGGVTGAGELALGKVSKEVAPYVARGVNYLTDAMPRPQAVTPEGLLMDVPQQAPTQPQTLLMEGDNAPSATQSVDNLPIAEPAQVVPPTDENPVGIIAFHGSGADFDEFKLEKIGTGEGAQAFGYGLYFTDSEDIAKFYRNSVSAIDRYAQPDFDTMAGSWTQEIGFDETGGQRTLSSADPDYDYYIDQLDNYAVDKATDLTNKSTTWKFSDGSELTTETDTVPTFNGKPLDSIYTQDVEDRFGIDIKNIAEKARKSGIRDDVGTLEDDISMVLANLSQGLSSKQDMKAALESLSMPNDGSRYQVLYENFIEPNIEFNEVDYVTLAGKPKGKIYKVGLEPKPEDLLDYDLPLSQQPKMLKLIDNVFGDSEIVITQAGLDPATATGGDFIKALEGVGGQGGKRASEFLRNVGIFGIKYRAAGSRGSKIDDAAAKRNYVIFDDKLIKIMEKYGIPAGVSVTAVKGAMQDTDDGLLAKDGQQPQGLL
jgi:hypothetical protein